MDVYLSHQSISEILVAFKTISIKDPRPLKQYIAHISIGFFSTVLENWAKKLGGKELKIQKIHPNGLVSCKLQIVNEQGATLMVISILKFLYCMQYMYKHVKERFDTNLTSSQTILQL